MNQRTNARDAGPPSKVRCNAGTQPPLMRLTCLVTNAASTFLILKSPLCLFKCNSLLVEYMCIPIISRIKHMKKNTSLLSSVDETGAIRSF